MEQFSGPILIERVAHRIEKNVDSSEALSSMAQLALQYLHSVDYSRTPHLHKLISATGLEASNWMSIMESKQNGIPILTQFREKSKWVDTMVLFKTLSHEYADAISTLETIDFDVGSHCRKLEKVIQLLIISKNYGVIDEIEHRLNGFIRNSNLNISKAETIAYNICKILICSSLFLQGRYFDCLAYFIKLIQEDDVSHFLSSRYQGNSFISSDEVLLMISLSALVAIPLESYEDFVHLEELNPFFELSTILTRCLKLLIRTKYHDFLTILQGEMDEICSKSYFLDQKWGEIQSTMRNKIYFFYLRVSNKLEVSYLSRTLGIEYSIVEKEVVRLIEDLHLNFCVTDGVIFYQERHEIVDLVNGLKDVEASLTHGINNLRQKNEMIRDSIQTSILRNSDNNEKKMGVNEMYESMDDSVGDTVDEFEETR